MTLAEPDDLPADDERSPDPTPKITLAAREGSLDVALREFELRKEVIQLVMPLFLRGNQWLFGFLSIVFLIDVALLARHY